MDFLKPFKSLFNRLVEPVVAFAVEKIDEHEHRPQKTPFEARLLEAFETCRHDDTYKAVRVSIMSERLAGPYSVMYEDPRTGACAWGAFDVGLVERHQSCADVIQRYNNAGSTVVMMLDPFRAPPEGQIPGWQLGTMSFPDRFLSRPLITVALDNKAQSLPPLPMLQQHQIAVGDVAMHQAVGLTPRGQRRAMPYYIRGVVDGGKSFTP